nr:MAG TPA: hypothetical protein [Caudoviricetes sp.]
MCVVRKSGGNIISFHIDERVECSALYFIILCLKQKKYLQITEYVL